MKQTRRQLILGTRNLVYAAAATQILPGLSFFNSARAYGQKLSDGNNTRPFLLIRVQGGMDCTLGLDPYTLPPGADSQDMFIEYRADEIARALQFPDFKVGPAAVDLLPYAAQSLIINGVLMNDTDNGHPASLNYISTGNGSSKNSSLPVEFACAHPGGPYGVLLDGNVSLAAHTAMITNTRDILSSVNGGDVSQAIKLMFKKKSKTEDKNSDYDNALQSLVTAAPVTAEVITALRDMQKTSTKLESEHAIAAGFLTGAASAAQLDIFENLDTHANHEKTHLALQLKVWKRIAGIAQLFASLPMGKKGSLLDNCLIMVVSEFSRTPYLNASKGKDHNPQTNSVLLMGGGTKMGRALNKSMLVDRKRSSTGAALHIGSPYNYVTKSPVQNRAEAETNDADYVFPENVAATVAKILEIDLVSSGALPKGTRSLI